MVHYQEFLETLQESFDKIPTEYLNTVSFATNGFWGESDGTFTVTLSYRMPLTKEELMARQDELEDLDKDQYRAFLACAKDLVELHEWTHEDLEAIGSWNENTHDT